MLYLKSMNIRNFKSIKSSDLIFSKGFTCIVGPNGSGKSNICDALLFGLGENALHRLRVEKLEGLINDSSKSKKNKLQKAFVKIEFDGEKKLELLRVARSDGKSVYRLNGKHTTRQEVLEELKSYKVDANETNTITQGEITKMLELSPKERRELIEISAGIKEFEEKKREALKELDKSNLKVGEAKIMLNERVGFLQELEKEKEVAEKYISMSSRYKALSYSVLVGKEKLVRSELEGLDEAINELDAKRKKIIEEIKYYNSKVSELDMERQSLTKSLNESALIVGEINKKLGIVNNGIVRLNVELEGLAREKENLSKRLDELSSESISANEKIAANKKEIFSANSELASAKLPEINEESSELDFEKKLDDIDSKIVEKENKMRELSSEISKAQAELYVASSRYELLKTEIKPKQKPESGIGNEIKAMNDELSSIASTVKNMEASISELSKKKEVLDSKLLELKEQRAMARRSDSLNLAQFSARDGFYGKASELISYKSEFAYAIEAAAGNRLEYFVVDSINVASNIIKYLKANGLGRATFIPIKELVIGSKERQNLRAIVDLVEFDKKFEKVFQYIFYDTYLIDKIEDAKTYGVGHRYVTLDGDLVEQSGVVSGGSKKKISINAIEKMIGQISGERDTLYKSIEESVSKLNELKKAEALMRLKIDEKTAMLRELARQADEEEKGRKAKAEEMEILAKNIEAMNEKLSKLLSEQDSVKNELESTKAERKRVYEKSMELAKAALGSSSKKEKVKLEQERKRIEELRIKLAFLEKENELLTSRFSSIEKEMSEKKKELKLKLDAEKEKTAKLKELTSEKSGLEEQIKNSSSADKSIYAKLENIESEIAKQSSNIGRLNAESSSADSKMQEMKIRRSQFEVRLGDLKAEVSMYSNEKIDLIEGKIDEMEREAMLLSDKIKELGNVNLKAPEMYKEREKAVSEAKSKVEMLDSERLAILKMIDEIDAKKYSVFIDTFNSVNRNFEKIYSYISEDKAELVLSNEKDPFNSELLIKLKTKENVSKRAESMSGGERSMMMLALIFAIHMYKHSFLYIFDEIDSALDKENSRKLSQLLKQLSADSQFIVVSHNDSLISNADAAIGVAKVNGESKIFGLQISSILSTGASDGKKA
ncbi:MAG: AAA family ATPase [Candidatus Micrarchaeia archaeon]